MIFDIRYKTQYSMIIIFYGMKSIVLFVAASLMLVGAAVVVAIPIQVEAEWCFSFLIASTAEVIVIRSLALPAPLSSS